MVLQNMVRSTWNVASSICSLDVACLCYIAARQPLLSYAEKDTVSSEEGVLCGCIGRVLSKVPGQAYRGQDSVGSWHVHRHI